jgi:hypothetical protein
MPRLGRPGRMAADGGGEVEEEVAQPSVSIRPDDVPNWQVPTLTPNPALSMCHISIMFLHVKNICKACKSAVTSQEIRDTRRSVFSCRVAAFQSLPGRSIWRTIFTGARRSFLPCNLHVKLGQCNLHRPILDSTRARWDASVKES